MFKAHSSLKDAYFLKINNFSSDGNFQLNLFVQKLNDKLYFYFFYFIFKTFLLIDHEYHYWVYFNNIKISKGLLNDTDSYKNSLMLL